MRRKSRLLSEPNSLALKLGRFTISSITGPGCAFGMLSVAIVMMTAAFFVTGCQSYQPMGEEVWRSLR